MKTKRGFTLLETVIALGIAVVVLGASVSTRQFLIQNSQVTESRTIMTSLADQTIEKMRLLRQAMSGFSGLGLVQNGPATNLVLVTTGTNGSINKLGYCRMNLLATDCPTTQMPVLPPGSVGDLLINLSLTSNAEIVAVAKSANNGAGKQVIDGTTYVQVPSNFHGQQITADPASSTYSFYNRQITVKYVKDSTTAPNLGLASPYPFYQVSVTVWPYGTSNISSANAVTRTMLFADQSSAPL